jgi:hypothetical protein
LRCCASRIATAIDDVKRMVMREGRGKVGSVSAGDVVERNTIL